MELVAAKREAVIGGMKSGILMTAGPVGGLRKHPHGRVDQLEDRYLGMVEAPSSNLGTSTRNDF